MLTLFFRRCVETSRLELGTGWNNFTPWAGFSLVQENAIFQALYWTNCHVEMKEYDPVRYTFLAVCQRSDFDKFMELMHLILASSQHLKWLWLAQWGTPATSSKQEVIFVSDWPRRGGTTCLLLPGFYSNSFHHASVLRLIQRRPNISKMEIIYVLWH